MAKRKRERKRGLGLAGVVEDIYANTKPEGGCLVTTSARNGYGYGMTWFGGRMQRSHRLVARHYLGPCPEGMEVRHLCGRGTNGCVTASHLRYGTHAENCRDTVRHGKVKVPGLKGSDNPSSKLTWQQVDELRRLRREGWTQPALGRRYGIKQASVSKICLEQTYKPEYDPRREGGR